MSNAFAQKMAGLEDEIHELAGETFNVGSPKQLGEILFDKMALEGGKRARPAPIPPAPTSSKTSPPNMTCPPACWTGGSCPS